MELVRSFAAILKLALLLALLGQLKLCTVCMLGLAADNSEHGWITYSAYTKLLTHPEESKR